MRYVSIPKGGTLSKIAQQEHIPLKALLFTNANLDPRRIQIGQKIAVPETEDDLLAVAEVHKERIHKTIESKPEKEVGNEPKRRCKECNFVWSKTPIVKLIISKESKGSYNAYNITGWKNGKNKVFESHFSPTSQYHIEQMTIQEIKKAQSILIGIHKKHLFAVGLYQCIPKTLNSFLDWIKKYHKITENTQFNKKSQDNLPWYFWEKKRPTVGKYFKGAASVEDAAYAISKEWASAGTPKGYKIATGKISNGSMSYYGGDGLNKAHYSASKTIEALKRTKKMLDDCNGYNSVKNKQLKNL